MSGIYIHIPYCRQACHYCNFHFSVSQKNKKNFLKALENEIFIQKDFFQSNQTKKTKIDTIYFGGGTPSILTTSEIISIFLNLKKYFDFSDTAEITLEANPEDLTYEKLLELKQTPVNRLSIGIQSFQQSDLNFMNRKHTQKQAIRALENAKKLGFENITADLIYGIPNLNDKNWKANVLQLVNMNIPHISAYCLTVEHKTALEVFIRRGKLPDVDEEQAARQFEILCKITENHNYHNYEISNFGLSGFFSKHNLAYWTGQSYLGLGPSAHSYKPYIRQWNSANTTIYINEIIKGKIPKQFEVLNKNEQYNEYVMTALRTMWGIDKNRLLVNFGKKYFDYLLLKAKKHLKNNMLAETKNSIIISKSGKFFADGIAADLFI